MATTTRAAYAVAQNIGLRSEQCDAVSVRTAADGARVFVLLDGIGSSPAIRDWTRKTAARLARSAARRSDAEGALRALHAELAEEADRQDPYLHQYVPSAAAVVAVAGPGRLLTVAWCGDSRAYLLAGGIARRLTEDHNLRRVYPPSAMNPRGGNRNRITSYLGSTYTSEQAIDLYGHPVIESTTVLLDGPSRLLLASDGAYEPHHDAGHDLVIELESDDPLQATVTAFVNLAVETSIRDSARIDPARPHADNATAILVDIPA